MGGAAPKEDELHPPEGRKLQRPLQRKNVRPDPRGIIFGGLPIGGESVGQIIYANAGAFRVGICVPDSCSDEQVIRGLEKNLCNGLGNGYVTLSNRDFVRKR